MATAEPIPHAVTVPRELSGPGLVQVPELRLYSHSRLIYWWPAWVVGDLIALLTRMQGQLETLGGVQMYVHPSKNLGVMFTVVTLMVILFTNVNLRGMVSVTVILFLMFTTLLFAYLGWWDGVLSWAPYLSMHMNMGFYVIFSSAVFLLWFGAVFVFDRLKFWRVRPGQMTLEYVIGGAEKSWDTRGMMFEMLPQDVFRNWLLGLGTCDVHVMTTGARPEDMVIPNIVFAARKVRMVQNLIAVKPDHLAGQVVQV